MPVDDEFEKYPALRRLRLDVGDLQVLAQQGFVRRERHGQQMRHKLRFRRGGRQQVRCIPDAAEAQLVTSELARLQSGRRLLRQLTALDREARQRMRESKLALEPIINAYGCTYHGRAIRRPRRPA